MGKVLMILRIMPSSVDIKPEQLKEDVEKALPEGCRLVNARPFPIAFGIVALDTYIEVPEKEGISEKVQNMIKNVESVSEVQVMTVTRV